jgi:uncharacterized protein affecting Mg2+/Co2+ transport
VKVHARGCYAVSVLHCTHNRLTHVQGEPVPNGMVKKAKLLRRHYDFYRSGLEQRYHQISGSGVVGQYPIICPGRIHTYQSSTRGRFGDSMGGYFDFQELYGLEDRPKREIQILCPRIPFTDPGFLY